MVRVKICGITNLADALAAVELGADALGFVFAESPRKVTPQVVRGITQKLPPWISTVGVFVDEKPKNILRIVKKTGIEWLQLNGDETPLYCRRLGLKIIKSLRIKDKSSLKKIKDYPVSGILLDTYSPDVYGGTGSSFDWGLAVSAKRFGKPVILAGGLNPENVLKAVKIVQPYAVDVSSGVESSPGKKDYEKMKRFMDALNVTI